MSGTDALIRRLAADLERGSAGPPAREGRLARAVLSAGLGAGLATALLVVLGLGVRPDLAAGVAGPAVLLKLASSLALAAGAYGLAFRTARPEASQGSLALLLPGGILLLSGLLADPAATATEAARLGGQPLACTAMIVALSLLPLLVVLGALRGGASTRPGVTGAAAGVLAGGLGAFAYGLHCPIDQTGLVTIWYGAAIATMAAGGAVLGRRLLAW